LVVIAAEALSAQRFGKGFAQSYKRKSLKLDSSFSPKALCEISPRSLRLCGNIFISPNHGIL
jgi:hypothetical protein